MGKFRFGSKNIQLLDIENISDNDTYIAPEIKEIIVEKPVEIIVERLVEKLVNVPTIPQIIKEIEYVDRIVEVEKIVEVENRKAIDELSLQLYEANNFLKQKQVKIDDLECSIELKKEHLNEVREQHNVTVLDLNKQKSKSKILTIALVVTSVIALLGVIF